MQKPKRDIKKKHRTMVEKFEPKTSKTEELDTDEFGKQQKELFKVQTE